ncbi:MAG: DNA-methyltransferase [Bdellovibrionales bacterium]
MDKLFFNLDCIEGAKKHIKSNSVDLMICDPPYGIEGHKLDKHYNRKETFVLEGYKEVSQEHYPEFSKKWLLEAERILKPGGSLYVVSGYTNLIHILNALKESSLKEMNHLIWKYNFGVYTKKKFVSSHYHLLFYVKKGKPHTFNTFCRFSDSEKSDKGHSLNYKDREDVWVIPKQYKPKQTKNKNELPEDLLKKIILYSSNQGDTVCDFFLGSFATAKTALGLNRKAIGFEVNKKAYDYQIKQIEKIKSGSMMKQISTPPKNIYFQQGKPLSKTEIKNIKSKFKKFKDKGMTQKKALENLSKEFGRGRWSLMNIIK